MKLKKKLAIISTFDDLCGIASYTRSIIAQLSPFFDIEVFDLDQFLFRGSKNKLRKLADSEIDKICTRLKEFDCVNVQLEHGTFGSNPKDIIKRLRRIFLASPSLCITFHTILMNDSSLWHSVSKDIYKARFISVYNKCCSYVKHKYLSSGIYNEIRKIQSEKSTSIIVHTRRDARNLKMIYSLDNVYDHPLAYYSFDQALQIREKSERNIFPGFSKIPKEDVIIGVFGFIGKYKGVDTALSALKLLPDNFHLAIFGGLHPNAIVKDSDIDPYIKSLLTNINPGKMFFDELNDYGDTIQTKLTADDLLRLISTKSRTDLSKRVHFMGALSDDDFPMAMSACDIVLLPYLEVGQSASGPMSMAVDLNCKIISSRTKTFMQFSRYHPNRFEMFDVGNYLQLAQLLETSNIKDVASNNEKYSTKSNVEVYKKALFYSVES